MLVIANFTKFKTLYAKPLTLNPTSPCRRQWSLAELEDLRYKFLLEWDKAMNQLDDEYGFLSSPHQWVTHIDQDKQVRAMISFLPFLVEYNTIVILS